MNWLVRLYPASWRKRYGHELDELVGQMPARAGTALDLLVGAAIAYRDVVRANRVLSAAGAYLHGLCVAVLVQAIVFVSLVMVAQGRGDQTVFQAGPVEIATFAPAVRFQLGPRETLGADVWIKQVAQAWVPELVLLAVLSLALAVVMAAPRLVRSLR